MAARAISVSGSAAGLMCAERLRRVLPLATPAEGPDEALFHLLNLAGSNPIADAFMIAVTTLGAAYLLAIVAVPLWWRGRREAAFDLLVLLGITVVITEAIKFAVGRPRPCDVLTAVRNLAGLGVHWPSDVLAGALLGVALAFAVERMSRRADRYRRLRSWILSKIPHRRPASP